MHSEILTGFRLSPQQKRLWLLQQNSSIYCSQAAILLSGLLHVEILKATIQIVVNRHEILRTNFHRRPGIKTPIQVIADNSTPSWRSFRLRDVDKQEQALRLEDLFQSERGFNFDLEQGSLLRLSLINIADNQHILLITLPSLCTDSYTLKNLVKEISQIYALCLQGKELLDEPIQYIQFSEWQNELLEEEEAETGKAYWQKQELKTKQPLSLPFEINTKIKGKFEPDVYSLDISQELTDKISNLATQYNISISEFLLTCWYILIWHLTNQSEIVISNLFSRRNYEDLHDILGLLAKFLPVSCPMNQEFKFKEILSQISEHQRQAEKYQEYFEGNDIINSELQLNGLPIGFEFEQLSDEYHAGEVAFSLYKRYVCFENFKIKLTCLQKKDSLITEFHYDINSFSADSIKRLAGQFQTLVANVVANREATINKLEIIDSKERHQLLVELNSNQTNYPQDKCIHDLFEQQVEQTPDNIAVVFENQQITYRELNARANQLARYLKRLGVGSEMLVGLYVERSLDTIIGLLGILKAGAAYLPLDATLPIEKLAFRLQDAQASLVITHSSLVNNCGQMTVICLDTDWQVIAAEAEDNFQTSTTPENLVYVLFTSGSTGKPKGVAVEHRQLVNYLYAILDRLNLPVGASYANVSSFAADLGNTVIFPALCTGGCLHIVSQARVADSQALRDYFQHHSIDCLKIVPSHLAALLNSSSTHSIFPHRCLILGGEAVNWDLIASIRQQTPKCKIFNHYGPTETTVGVLTYAVSDELASNPKSKPVPLGQPLANTQVYVLNKQLQLVPIGVPGELYIGGTQLARGYLNQIELTAERFITNPFKSTERLYKTGDLVRYLPDGNLEFLGRVDHQVKIRGFRIELGEIEAVLTEHPGLRQAVVVVREDVPGEKRLVAYLVPNQKQKPTTSQLRSYLKVKLLEYMIPSVFVMLKVLPLTSNGKVNRQDLPAPETTRPELAETFVAPRTPAEEVIAEIWKQVLGVERVGIHDNFFELGGHSLLATQVISRLREDFQVELPLVSLFGNPTVEGLVKAIAQIYGQREVVEEIAQILISP